MCYPCPWTSVTYVLGLYTPGRDDGSSSEQFYVRARCVSELVWHKAALIGDFAMQPCLPVIIAGHAILLVQWQGHVYAYANNCPHENLPLTGALIEHDELICPHHGARFCIANGTVMAPPAFEDLEIFPIKLENQTIYVGIHDEF